MSGVSLVLRRLSLVLLAVALFSPAAIALTPLDLRDGDLIFQHSTSRQSEAIRIATGSDYTHMGIVHITARGPVVIEAAGRVAETPLAQFLARGVAKRFTTYRVKGLSPQQAELVIAAAKTYLGRPYDIFFRPDTDAIYCSELPFLAFQAAGIQLGRIERFSDLAINNASVRALFLSRWRAHPDCGDSVSSAAGCWAKIQNQSIVTPVGIAQDAKVERVYGWSSMQSRR